MPCLVAWLTRRIYRDARALLYTADQVLINPVLRLLLRISLALIRRPPPSFYLSRQEDYCVLLLSARIVLDKSCWFLSVAWLRLGSSLGQSETSTDQAYRFETSWWQMLPSSVATEFSNAKCAFNAAFICLSKFRIKRRTDVSPAGTWTFISRTRTRCTRTHNNLEVCNNIHVIIFICWWNYCILYVFCVVAFAVRSYVRDHASPTVDSIRTWVILRDSSSDSN